VTERCRDSSDSPKTWSYSAARMSLPTTGPDHVAWPAVAVALAGSNTVTVSKLLGRGTITKFTEQIYSSVFPY